LQSKTRGLWKKKYKEDIHCAMRNGRFLSYADIHARAVPFCRQGNYQRNSQRSRRGDV